MKKLIITFLLLLLAPTFVSATIDQNLYYGLKQNSKVIELQQFLVAKGFLNGQPTGNFYSLTLTAVKKYQASKNIIKTGYVGPLTRQAIDADLSSVLNVKPVDKIVPNPTPISVPLTGSLNLSQNPSYLGQTVTAPRLNFKLSDFTLTNNTTEAINLKTIEIDLAMGSNLYSTNLYVTNLYLAYGNNKTATFNTVEHQNYYSIDYQLPIGQTINLSLYGDVNVSIPVNSTINSSILVTGTTAISKTNINTNSNAVLDGQNIIFGKESLTVNKDSLTPLAKIYVGNQRITAGKFQFTSVGDSYTISELKFIVPNSSNISLISGVVLSDDVKQLSKLTFATYDGNNSVFNFNFDIPILINSSKTLTLYYDLSSNISSYSTNINIAPILVYVKALDSRNILFDGSAANYNTISFYGGITLPDAGITVNNVYVYKSIPTFTAVASSTSVPNNSNVNLYTFSIGADPAGDISVKQIMFIVTINDPNNNYPHLNHFSFLKGNRDYTSSVAIAETVNNNYIGLTSDFGIGIGTNTIILTFNQEENIPAGKNQTYTLKAVSNNFVAGSSASTYVPSDTAISNNGSYLRMMFTNVYGLSKNSTDVSVASNYDLLWSDKSATFPYHSDSNGSSTNDWYNGFQISNLPLSSQTVVAEK